MVPSKHERDYKMTFRMVISSSLANLTDSVRVRKSVVAFQTGAVERRGHGVLSRRFKHLYYTDTESCSSTCTRIM